VAVARDIGGEYADLAVGDLAGRAGVLPRHPAGGLALLEKSGLVDHQDRILLRQRLDDIVAHDLAQRIGLPAAAAKDRLLAPRAGITGCLGPHPSGLAPFTAEQTVQEQPRRGGHPLLGEQRPHPRFSLPQRGGPQFQRCLDRCRRHPSPQNQDGLYFRDPQNLQL
jgi:hypothetical protein